MLFLQLTLKLSAPSHYLVYDFFFPFPTISHYTNKHHFVCLSFIIFIFLCVFSDLECGYIHNVSPVKKSKSNHQWYEFQFQTSSDVKRVVAFNIPSYSNLRHDEQNKVPVQLKNLIVKEDNNCILNQQSVVNQASSSDVRFQHCVQPKPESA